jgi:hypothetical protein
MPKWAARCWAVIESVREERLQDITPVEVRREGVSVEAETRGAEWTLLHDEWVRLWDSINGSKPGLSWADNPTVARIQFRRIDSSEAP